MKTALAGLIALFALFAWAPQPVVAACCSPFDAGITGTACTKPVACPDAINWCDTANDCATAANTGGIQPPGGTTPGTGQTGAAPAFDPFKDCPENQVNTAIGCIPTEPSAFITKFLRLGIGMAGGIAFLLILFGGFQILTSAGNPEQLNAGRELVGSAVTGLLLIIFSIFLLRLIGMDILGIPGFG